jgi:L-amino acid N-acyltransferase YncA
MNIRPLIPTDAVAVHAHGSQEPAFRLRHDRPSFWSIEQLGAWFASRQDVCLGIFENGVLEGFILAAVHAPTCSARIENVWTLSSERRRGHAKRLLSEALQLLAQKGIVSVTSAVGSENPPSFFLHRRNGFDASVDTYRLMLNRPAAVSSAA